MMGTVIGLDRQGRWLLKSAVELNDSKLVIRSLTESAAESEATSVEGEPRLLDERDLLIGHITIQADAPYLPLDLARFEWEQQLLDPVDQFHLWPPLPVTGPHYLTVAARKQKSPLLVNRQENEGGAADSIHPCGIASAAAFFAFCESGHRGFAALITFRTDFVSVTMLYQGRAVHLGSVSRQVEERRSTPVETAVELYMLVRFFCDQLFALGITLPLGEILLSHRREDAPIVAELQRITPLAARPVEISRACRGELPRGEFEGRFLPSLGLTLN